MSKYPAWYFYMKKKLLIILLCLTIPVIITGCDIKFIEKVEPEPTQETTEEDFGSLIIEETSETTKLPETENSSENTSETIKQTESTESTISTEPEEEGTFIYAGIKFIKDDTEPTMYCKEDCTAKISPSIVAKDYSALKKGEFVTVIAMSENNQWAMVSVFGGPSSFILNEFLTTEEIRQEQTLTQLETTSSETQSSETTTESSQSQQPSEQPQQPVSSESYSEYQEPEDNYSGIGFPSDASSTSFNMGVEFADVTATLRVRKDGTQISDGPDRVSNTTGYYSIGTLNKGDSISCTGIGRNGFVRVEYSGNVGFIDSKNVEY